MTKYSTYNRSRPKKQEKPHPIWRGIGCLIVVLVPLVSYAAAILTIDYGLSRGWRIPNQLLGYPTLPDFIFDFPALATLLFPITRVVNFYAYLVAMFLYIMTFGGLLSFGYALLYRFIGPPRWGPSDAPPPRGIRPKPYKR